MNNILHGLHDVIDAFDTTQEECPLVREAMCEGRVGCMQDGSGKEGLSTNLSIPVNNLVMDIIHHKITSAQCSSEVSLAFTCDMYSRLRKNFPCFSQVLLFHY